MAGRKKRRPHDGKPKLHYGKWRIRWLDEHGKRRSATFDTYAEAKSAEAS